MPRVSRKNNGQRTSIHHRSRIDEEILRYFIISPPVRVARQETTKSDLSLTRFVSESEDCSYEFEGMKPNGGLIFFSINGTKTTKPSSSENNPGIHEIYS